MPHDPSPPAPVRDPASPGAASLPASLPAEGSAPNGWAPALLEGFRAGERRALTEVYRLHAGDIARMLQRGFSFDTRGRSHRFVGYASAFELQDALHETFRLAFEPRARQGYDGIRPYGPYLRTIARNVVLKSFRAREKLFPSVDARAIESTAGVTVSQAPLCPERQVHDAQVRALVDAFVRELAPADRELVQVRFVDGLSQRDAAEKLRLGRQRLRTRELKLRKQLLAFLRARGEEGLVTNGMWLPFPTLAWAREVLR